MSERIKMRNWMKRSVLLATLVIPVIGGCHQADSGDTKARAATALRTIGFMTDFDTRDDAVGICKAVMDSIAPGVRIIDITHQVVPFDIAEGARFLAGSTPYYARDAVFVVVVDPTVGTSRKAIIARSRVGQFFVLPDNGLLTLVQKRDGIESVREITNPDWMIGTRLSSTFHGRDIFSPTAAHLARGDDWTKAGPELDSSRLVQLQLTNATVVDGMLHGSVIGTDGPYGNLILNVQGDQFAALGYKVGDDVPAVLDGRAYKFPFVKTFGDVPVGHPLFFIDSRGRLSLGINQRNFEQMYKVSPQAELAIPRKNSGMVLKSESEAAERPLHGIERQEKRGIAAHE